MHPPLVWELTPDEIDVYLDALEQIAKEHKQAEQKARRARPRRR